MRHRQVWPVVWAGLGLSLAADVVYVTDLTIFTHLAPCAASAVSSAVMAMTTSVCPPGVTGLQSCICSTTSNHNIVETRISNSVYNCNSTATGEQASARTVYEAYCGRRPDTDEDESNAGVIAGAVVGTVLGLAAGAAGLLFYLRRRRNAKDHTRDGVHPQPTPDDDDDIYPAVHGTAAVLAPTVSSTSTISKTVGPPQIDNVSPVSGRTTSRPVTAEVHMDSSPPPTKAPPLPPLSQHPAQQGEAGQQTLAGEDAHSSASQKHMSTDEEQSGLQSHQTSTQSEVTGQQSRQTSTQSEVTSQEVHTESSVQGTPTHAQSHEFQFDLADHGSSTSHASPKVQQQESFYSELALSSSPPTRQFLPRLEMQGQQPLMDWSESSYYSTTSRQVSHSGLSSEHSSYTVTNAHSPPSAAAHGQQTHDVSGASGSRSFSTSQQRTAWHSGSVDGFREMD